MGLLEEITSLDALRRAWESVALKRGVPGIDRVSVTEFGARLMDELERLSQEIQSGGYRPLPVVRIRPTFLGAAERALVVPAVRDRVVQRAIADILAPRIEPVLCPACRAFRKGSSARGAAEDVGRWITGSLGWILRADVRSFFDSIQPEILHRKLEPFVDPEGLRFLDRILRCRIFDHDQVSEMVTGIAQGSPLSPLLANLYLAEVDAALAKEHPNCVRYCDDVLVAEPSEERVRQAHEQIVELLQALELVLNEDKTRICRAEDGFVFLGYHFGPAGRGPAVKAVAALHHRLEEISAAGSLEPEEIDSLYRGWTAYFGRRPECWTTSPAGILALLRCDAAEEPDADRLVEARWTLPGPVSPLLAFGLAAQWAARGRPEQSWLELAAVAGGSQSGLAASSDWAHLLGVSADSLGSLLSRLSGTQAERAQILAEALAELSRYELASRLSTAGARVLASPKAAAPSGGAAVQDEDILLLTRWFQGREGVHATESVNQAGHRSFVPVQRPISPDDWRRHLRGERTRALPLVRSGDTVFIGVLDVDLEKRLLDERLGERNALLGRALATAFQLREELRRRSCQPLLEASGFKGFHLWIRFSASPRRWRALPFAGGSARS